MMPRLKNAHFLAIVSVTKVLGRPSRYSRDTYSLVGTACEFAGPSQAAMACDDSQILRILVP